MRCSPERAEYYFGPSGLYFFTRTYLKADANFNARYVRLSFERRDDSQTKRYRLVWDAISVGGLISDGQRALVR